MAEKEDYIDGIRRDPNKAHQQNDVVEIEGIFKTIGKLYKKEEREKYFRNPRIAEMESLYELHNRALPKKMTEKNQTR